MALEAKEKHEDVKWHLQFEVKIIACPVCPFLNETESRFYDGEILLHRGVQISGPQGGV